MSRWIDTFKTHAFRANWESVKDAASAATIEDRTVATSVNENARLKKALGYIDEVMDGLDPELVPMTLWDQFRDQAAACADQIIQFNASKNIAHIQQANLYVDNLLSYVRPYMIVKGRAGIALQSAAVAYADTVNKFASSFATEGSKLLSEMGEDRVAAAAQLGSVKQMGADIVSKHALLMGGANGAGLFAEIEEKSKEIIAYQAQLLIGSEDDPSIKQRISQAREEIIKHRSAIDALFLKVDGSVKELEKFYARIFGLENQSGEKQGGLASELDERMGELKTFEGHQSTKYEALNSQIESLLPGATSAGLASAYKEMKDSFEQPIRNASAVFYVSIAALVAVSFILSIEQMTWKSIAFVKLEDWQDILRSLAHKSPFYGPVLWLAFYATKRRSEYQRLQQEYAHKEALAKSYDSYRKQIEALGSEDSGMLKDLILKSVNAIAHNASSTLDGKHGDKMPSQEMVEKLVVLLAAEAKKYGARAAA